MCIRVDDDQLLQSTNDPRIDAPAAAPPFEWTATVEWARASTGASAVILSPGPDEDCVTGGAVADAPRCLVRGLTHLAMHLAAHRPAWPAVPVGAASPPPGPGGGLHTSAGEHAQADVIELQRRFGLRHLVLLQWQDGASPPGWIALVNAPAARTQVAGWHALAEALRERCTLQQRARDALLLTERLEDVARASGDWIWETDEQHRYTWVHDASPHGHAPGVRPPRVGEPIPAGVVVNWLGGPDVPLRNLHAVLQQREPIVRLVTKERAAEGVRYVSRSAVPLLRADGSLRGYRGSARDVTQSLDAKAQLWRRDELLRRAKEQAEASSAAKSVLVSKVGHELRTPLNAIVGLAQLIQARGGDGAGNAVVDEWIAQIARTGWHMVDVLDLLMELGRAGATGAALAGEPVDVVAVARDALRFVEHEAVARGIGIVLDGPPSARAAGDRRALCQVLVNLLGNAIKYNRAGGSVWLRVQLADRVRIDVQDTGPGLTQAQIARLFRPFERLGRQHGPIQGHGLGLAICQELVVAMGGTLQVHGVEGRGSTFSVLLPAPQPADEGPGFGAAPQASARGQHAGRTNVAFSSANSA